MNKLKIALLIFLTILTSILLLTNNNKIEKHRKTSISVNNTIFNVGVKSERDSSIAIFNIKNIGKDTLFILDMITDCHCTAISSSKGYAISGEELEIRAEYDNSSTGFFQQSIIVHTNSIQSPTLLIMRGRITN